MFRSVNRFLFVAIVAGVGLATVASVWAQSTSSTTTGDGPGVAAGRTAATQNAQKLPADYARFSNAFASCVKDAASPAASGLNGGSGIMAQATQAGISSINEINDILKSRHDTSGRARVDSMGCTEVPPPFDSTKDIKCDHYKKDGEDPSFDDKEVQTDLSIAQASEESISCKDRKFKEIQAEINCIQSEAASLHQYISAMQTQYASMMKTAGDTVNNLDQLSQAVDKQKAAVVKKSQDLQQIYNDINKQISADAGSAIEIWLASYDAANKKRDDFTTEQRNLRQAVLQNCMLKAPDQPDFFHPTGGGGVNEDSSVCSNHSTVRVSFVDALACRVRERVLNGQNGSRNQNLADDMATRAANLVRQMLADPDLISATNEQDFVARLNSRSSAGNVPSYADRLRQLSNDINRSPKSSGSVNDVDLLGLVAGNGDLGLVPQCYNTALTEMNRGSNKLSDGQSISDWQRIINDNTRRNNEQFQGLLSGMNSQYSKIMANMYQSAVETNGSSRNANADLLNIPGLASCRNQSLSDAQRNCVVNAREYLRKFVDGDASIAAPMFVASGRQDLSSQPPACATDSAACSCNSLKDCSAKYDAWAQKLDPVKENYDGMKQGWVTGTNGMIDQFRANMAQSLSQATARLEKYKQAVNAKLMDLGFQGNLAWDYIHGGDKPDMQKNGLYPSDMDMLAFIGGNAKPPVIDLTTGKFEDSLKDIAKSRYDQKKDMAAVEPQINALQKLLKACPLEVAKKKEDQRKTDEAAARTSINNLAMQFGSCGKCTASTVDQLDNLAQSLATLHSSDMTTKLESSTRNAVMTLEMGINDGCNAVRNQVKATAPASADDNGLHPAGADTGVQRDVGNCAAAVVTGAEDAKDKLEQIAQKRQTDGVVLSR